jgi:hypothetical protein
MPSSLSELVTGASATGTGGTTLFLELFLPPRFLADLPVVFFAAFLVLFFAAFFVDFLAAFVDFFAPPRPLDFAALFFVPLRPPLRAPLDFLVPFLAAISLAPFVGLSVASP